MTPKKHAEMLINKFNYADEAYYHECFKDSNLGKICALVAVDEILDNMMLYQENFDAGRPIHHKSYWQEVKKEIEKL